MIDISRLAREYGVSDRIVPVLSAEEQIRQIIDAVLEDALDEMESMQTALSDMKERLRRVYEREQERREARKQRTPSEIVRRLEALEKRINQLRPAGPLPSGD